jgi:hypothetical protein
MADEIIGVTIPELPEGGTLTGAEQFEMVQDGVSRRTTAQEVADLAVGIIPDIESGQWNPTPTNVSGSPTVSVLAGNYSRVGGVGTCSLFLEVTQGTAESDCEFRLDLPIASNFANVKDAFGIIAYNGITPTELLSWNIKANTATNDISIELGSVTDEFNYQYIYAILQYVII